MKRLIILCMLLCTSVWAFSQNCAANAGGDQQVCYTEADFNLAGTPPLSNGASPLNPVWTALSGGFVIGNPNSLNSQVTPNGGVNFSALQNGFYDFELCVDCTVGVSCDTVTVHIGTDPSQAAIAGGPFTACTSVTLTGSMPGSFETGEWSNLPVGVGDITTTELPPNQVQIDLVDFNSCDLYDFVYTINNGGCLSHDTTQVDFIGTEPLSATHNGGNPVCLGPFTMFGSFDGCGATSLWTATTLQGSGTIAINNPAGQNTQVTPSAAGTYETVPTTFTLTGNTCPNTYTYSWTVVANDGLTPPTITSPNSPTLSFNHPAGGTRSEFFTVTLSTSGPNGCTDSRFWRIYSLPQLNPSAPVIGLGCQGDDCVDLRDFVDYTPHFQSLFNHSAIVVAAPANSSLGGSIGSNTPFNCVDITTPGQYIFDLVISVTDAITGIVCSDTVTITIIYGDPGNINAGQDVLTCDTCASLNGNPPNFPVNQLWTQIGGPATTFDPVDGIAEDVTVCGLDNSMPGLVYTYVYSWNVGPGCDFSDTVTIEIDSCAPCDSLFIDIVSCCHLFEAGGGNAQKRSSNSMSSGTQQQIQQMIQAQYGVNMDTLACDPCVDGYIPVWAVNENGTPYLGPPQGNYQITWTYVDDNNVTQTIPGFVILAEPNITYTVTICDENGECCSTDTVRYECCDLESIEITSCCDPCEDPDNPFWIWVLDQDGNILNAPNYTFLWSTGSTANSILANVNTQYSVTVTDTFGCEFVDTFYVECCEDCIEINTCYGPHGNPNSGGVGKKSAARTFTGAEKLFLSREIRKHVKSGALPAGTTFDNRCTLDPCDGGDIFAWVEDCDGNIITPTVTWVGSDGTTQTGPTATLQADVTYTVTWIAADGCEYTDTYIYECDDCTLPPTNLRCERGMLVWDPVPGAIGYMVYATPYTFESRCCPIIRNGQSTWAQTTGTSINPGALNQRGCFLWRVVPICPDGSHGTGTPWFCCNERGGDGGIKYKDQLSSKEAQEAADNVVATGITAYLSGDLRVTPNPSNGQISLEGYSVLKGSVVRVFDVLGQLVHSSNIQSEMKQQIDLGSLLGGNYLLVIESPDVDVPARSWITIE